MGQARAQIGLTVVSPIKVRTGRFRPHGVMADFSCSEQGGGCRQSGAGVNQVGRGHCGPAGLGLGVGRRLRPR